jgi:hypothetical protein
MPRPVAGSAIGIPAGTVSMVVVVDDPGGAVALDGP